jgi:hypothetical protein
MLIALLALALQQQPKPAPLAPRDTVAIQKAARDHLKHQAPVARIGQVRGDTAYVSVGDHISWTLVRVVRRRERWVALNDTLIVTGIR